MKLVGDNSRAEILLEQVHQKLHHIILSFVYVWEGGGVGVLRQEMSERGKV